jgi:hypothetical protein
VPTPAFLAGRFQKVGVKPQTLECPSDDELGDAFATVVERGAGAVVVGPLFGSTVVPFAAQYKIPAAYQGRGFALRGGLMSYSRDADDEIRLAWITTERNLPDNQRTWRTRLTQSPCRFRQPKWRTDNGFAQLPFVRCLNFCHSPIQAIDTRNAW